MKPIVVIISADIEWGAIRKILPDTDVHDYVYGEWFTYEITAPDQSMEVIFVHGGWGKISAAGSAQYLIDRWKPELIINLGTCGGFSGEVERGSILLVERTIVYDIFEQMGDSDDHISHYTTNLDLSWLGDRYPTNVKRTTLVSGDRDLIPIDIPELKAKYGAIAGDWESGAIAFVAAKNKINLLILRGVSDLVTVGGGEVYGNIDMYRLYAQEIMEKLVEILPAWVRNFISIKMGDDKWHLLDKSDRER
jgi:adenosylhomocysteine nucleosidase